MDQSIFSIFYANNVFGHITTALRQTQTDTGCDVASRVKVCRDGRSSLSPGDLTLESDQ